MKIVIIGNSGSGKTWLAEKICNNESKLIHLDSLFWKPGGFEVKRGKAELINLIRKSLQNDEWVAEGVFGELIKYYTPEAEELIWLDMPWSLCHKRLMQRFTESKKHMNRTQSLECHNKLIGWAQNYHTRTDSKSIVGHKKIYDSFKRSKRVLRSDADIDNYLKCLSD